MEITSPGGMVNGTLIQNLDIKRVPSMRRNKVISDIFSRLEYMERRGGGLVKIFKGYKNKNIKPYFYSTGFSFTVVFPNACYKSNGIKETENTETSETTINEKDYFELKMYRSMPRTVRDNTFNQIKKIFQMYGFKYTFKRKNIEDLLNIKQSRAIDIIALLVKYDLIESINNTYIFKK